MSSTTALAAEHPTGDIVIYNTSSKNITAEVGGFGKFDLAANGQQSVPYDSLAEACSNNPTHCTAQFYVENTPVGFATINTSTGKLVSMKLSMKVRTSQDQQVLRSVTIQ